MNDVERIDKVTWRGIELVIEHTPNWAVSFDHIAITTIDKAILPITETGYKSHFLPLDQIAKYGDAVAYVLAWLEHEGESEAWKKHEAKIAQMELF